MYCCHMFEGLHCLYGKVFVANSIKINTINNNNYKLTFISSDAQQKIDNIKLSVEKAKEAVSLDLVDGVSWCEFSKNVCSKLTVLHSVQYYYITKRTLHVSNSVVATIDVLGNAYLSLFFLGSQSPALLKQSLASYARAVSTHTCTLRFNIVVLFFIH